MARAMVCWPFAILVTMVSSTAQVHLAPSASIVTVPFQPSPPTDPPPADAVAAAAVWHRISMLAEISHYPSTPTDPPPAEAIAAAERLRRETFPILMPTLSDNEHEPATPIPKLVALLSDNEFEPSTPTDPPPAAAVAAAERLRRELPPNAPFPPLFASVLAESMYQPSTPNYPPPAEAIAEAKRTRRQTQGPPDNQLPQTRPDTRASLQRQPSVPSNGISGRTSDGKRESDVSVVIIDRPEAVRGNQRPDLPPSPPDDKLASDHSAVEKKISDSPAIEEKSSPVMWFNALPSFPKNDMILSFDDAFTNVRNKLQAEQHPVGVDWVKAKRNSFETDNICVVVFFLVAATTIGLAFALKTIPPPVSTSISNVPTGITVIFDIGNAGSCATIQKSFLGNIDATITTTVVASGTSGQCVVGFDNLSPPDEKQIITACEKLLGDTGALRQAGVPTAKIVGRQYETLVCASLFVNAQCGQTWPIGGCANGFTGITCSTCLSDHFGSSCALCPTCGQFGLCDAGKTGTGKCICQAGYSGPNCQIVN